MKNSIKTTAGMVSGIGEVSFCLWLLIMGVNETKWKEKALTVPGKI